MPPADPTPDGAGSAPGSGTAAAPAPKLSGPRLWLRWVLTLTIGTLGGALFVELRMPLPWMLGALFCTMGVTLAGVRLAIPMPFRNAMMLVLGVMLGGSFTPKVLHQFGAWTVSLLVLLAFIALASAIVQLYLRWAAGYDGVTAFFAAAPGGLSEMSFVGSALGGDEREIALIHSARILITASIIPLGFRIFQGGAIARPFMPSGPIGPLDVALLVASGLLGYFVAQRLRFPAPHLIGPMLVSAAVHFAGLTASRPPGELIAFAQIAMGSAVGCRFSGVPVRRVARALGLGLVSTAALLLAVLGVAAALHAWTGLDFEALMLAYAPGGLPEMTLIALTLNIDVAFVSFHHLVRVVFIMVCAPILFRAFPEWFKEPAA